MSILDDMREAADILKQAAIDDRVTALTILGCDMGQIIVTEKTILVVAASYKEQWIDPPNFVRFSRFMEREKVIVLADEYYLDSPIVH